MAGDVAPRIAEQIGVSMTPNKTATERRAASRVFDAQQAYSTGSNNWSKLSCEGFQSALRMFQQVAASVPNY